MRVFDLIGAVAVTSWVALVGTYAFQTYLAPEAEDFGGSVVLREGESWMLLTREDKEVGYLHETRTSLDDDRGWLLEYDLLMNVQMLGINQFLKTNIKASVDPDAYLEQFTATIGAGGTEFGVKGHVEGTKVVMKLDVGDSPREQTLDLGQRPRLANSAINELIARDELTPGQRFEQEYFDPTAMGMTKIVFEYVREHDVTVYDETRTTHHFRQLVAGNDLDVYVDKHGEVYIQEFPFRIIGARVPAELAMARAQAMRRDFQQNKKEGVDLGLETAMGLLKGDRGVMETTTRYRISNIPDDATLELDSRTQKAVERGDGSAVVDTSERAERRGLDETRRPELLKLEGRVDGNADAFGELLRDVEARTEASDTALAEETARIIADAITTQPEVGLMSASQVIEAGHGDCTEYALAYVAALRRLEIPARFVFGLKPDERGHLKPHQWVQYWNGAEFVDVDLSDEALVPASGQLQLLTGPDPEHPHYVHLLDTLQIEALADADDASGTASDFN